MGARGGRGGVQTEWGQRQAMNQAEQRKRKEAMGGKEVKKNTAREHEKTKQMEVKVGLSKDKSEREQNINHKRLSRRELVH
jgi:hypothetical protein